MVRLPIAAAVVLLVCSSADCWAITEEEQAEIVAVHNSLRSNVEPIATNMERMSWNEELQYMAQLWVKKCVFKDNEDRHTESSEFDYVGENMLAAANNTVNYTALINEWFNEGEYYHYENATCIDDDGEENENGCEGYTQVVWAESYAVGCASTYCYSIEESEYEDSGGVYFVCYYGPGGNFVGERPYKTGNESCSACPNNKPYCSNNLCESGAPAVANTVPIVVLLLVAATISLF